MQGPSAATMSLRWAPSLSIAVTVASTTPVSAPFQPACAAPMTRARAFRPQLGYGDRFGRVNLERHGETLRRRSELCRDPGAVLGHRLRRVTRADATIQRRVNALRDPPETGEKAMRNAGNPERFRGQELSRAHADLALADWNPGGGGSLRSATAIVLKRAPISP